MISGAQAIARYREFMGDTDPDWVTFGETIGERNIFTNMLVCILLSEISAASSGGGTSITQAEVTAAIQNAANLASGSLESVTLDLDAIASAIGAINVNLADVETLLTSLDGTATALDSDVNIIRARQVAISAQMDLIQPDIDLMQQALQGTGGTQITSSGTLNAVGAGTAIDLTSFVVPVNGDFYFTITASGGNSITVSFESAETSGGVWRPIQAVQTFTADTEGQAWFAARNFQFVRVNVTALSGTASIDYQFRARRGV